MASYASPRKGKQIFIREVIDEILHITYAREIATFPIDVYFADICHTLTVNYELLNSICINVARTLKRKHLKAVRLCLLRSICSIRVKDT